MNVLKSFGFGLGLLSLYVFFIKGDTTTGLILMALGLICVKLGQMGDNDKKT